MTHYLSCGHAVQETDEGNEAYVMLSVATCVDDYDGMKNVIYYGSYCKECAKELDDDGLVLHNEQEEDEWLYGGDVK